jgi:hypothetical protein
VPLSIPGFLKLDYDKDFKVNAGLGSGGTAVITLGTLLNEHSIFRNNNQTEVAIKHYRQSSDLTEEEVLINFRYELAIMS